MGLTKFKFQLEKGSRKFKCPSCNHKRFVRYVDQETGNYLQNDIGRCDRELNCGYHKPPREGRTNISNISYSKSMERKKSSPSFIHYEYLKQSLDNYDNNTLIKWLASLPGWNRRMAVHVAKLYRVGTSQDGWAIFWQIDLKGKIRSGKMMAYSDDGRRIKEGYSQDWVHSKLIRTGRLEEFNLVQCFYGLHLLDDRPVAIVESEKTALIASQYLPQFTWMASGQLNGINETKLIPLKGRKIVLYPDIGCYKKWNKKALALSHIGEISVSNLLERRAPENHKGYDLADYLIQYDLKIFTEDCS